MKNPTQQELMEFVDGVLPPPRRREIEQRLESSPRLRQEAALLRAMRNTVRNETIVRPSKHFTSSVLGEVLPQRNESLLYRLVKNSSNIFAMTLVLSLIGIVLAVNPSDGGSGTDIFSKSIGSYSAAYRSVADRFSLMSEQVIRPVGEASKTFSGKFLYVGIAAFILLIVADEVFGRRYTRIRYK